MRTKKNAGFSLVEVLVAATLLVLSILAVVAVIRKGVELEVNDLHRRKARAAISSFFENPKFSYTKYTTLMPQVETDTTVVIDDRTQSGTVLRGTLKATIGAEEVQFSVPIKRIRVSVRWNEGGEQDSIVIEKWITQALL